MEAIQVIDPHLPGLLDDSQSEGPQGLFKHLFGATGLTIFIKEVFLQDIDFLQGHFAVIDLRTDIGDIKGTVIDSGLSQA